MNKAVIPLLTTAISILSICSCNSSTKGDNEVAAKSENTSALQTKADSITYAYTVKELDRIGIRVMDEVDVLVKKISTKILETSDQNERIANVIRMAVNDYSQSNAVMSVADADRYLQNISAIQTLMEELERYKLMRKAISTQPLLDILNSQEQETLLQIDSIANIKPNEQGVADYNPVRLKPILSRLDKNMVLTESPVGLWKLTGNQAILIFDLNFKTETGETVQIMLYKDKIMINLPDQNLKSAKAHNAEFFINNIMEESNTHYSCTYPQNKVAQIVNIMNNGNFTITIKDKATGESKTLNVGNQTLKAKTAFNLVQSSPN